MSSPAVNPRARAVWARTSLRVWPGALVLASLPPSALAEAADLVGRAAGFAALVLERDEVSLTVEEESWRASPLRALASAEAGPYRAITLEAELELGMVGYLAPAAGLLAEAGVSIVPQCAYLKDHLLVRDADLETARRVLEGFIAECRR
jgi:hypothetical protein